MTEQTWPVSQCSAAECRAPIVWARTDTGSTTPVDAQPNPAGRWRLVPDPATHPAPRARYVKQADRAGRAGELHTAHWATCAKPNRYRR